jgi:hypothetical protein
MVKMNLYKEWDAVTKLRALARFDMGISPNDNETLRQGIVTVNTSRPLSLNVMQRMKTFWVAIVWMLLCGTCLATPQVGDGLIYQGKGYSVYGPSLDVYFGESNALVNVLPDIKSSACWRGYTAVWEVQNDGRLFLNYITAADFRTEIPISSAFPGQKGPFHATWYTGTMENPRICVIPFYGGVGGYYLYWKTFTFRNGKLVTAGIRPGWPVVFYSIVFFIALVPIVISPLVRRLIRRRRKGKKATTPSEGEALTGAGCSDTDAPPLWYISSTRIALSLVLFYILFTFGVRAIPIIVELGAMEELLLWWTPPISLFCCLTAMTVRVRGCTLSGPAIIWTGIRYGIISTACTVFVIMFFASVTPAHIRLVNRMHRQMPKRADVRAIRAWAKSYQPVPEEERTPDGRMVYVMADRWPQCVSELDPYMLRYSIEEKTAYVMYGHRWYYEIPEYWGLAVGPKGTKPNGDHVKPLQDGVWVWYEDR